MIVEIELSGTDQPLEEVFKVILKIAKELKLEISGLKVKPWSKKI